MAALPPKDPIADKLDRYETDRDDARTCIDRDGLYRPLAVILRKRTRPSEIVTVLLYERPTGGYETTVECPPWKEGHAAHYAAAALQMAKHVRYLCRTPKSFSS